MGIEAIIIPFISGIAGFGGGIIASYVKWNIEKKKMKVENRKERIDKWRTKIEQANSFSDLTGMSVISELIPFATEEELKTLNANIATQSPGGGGLIKKRILYEVISRIEKNWDLI